MDADLIARGSSPTVREGIGHRYLEALSPTVGLMRACELAFLRVLRNHLRDMRKKRAVDALFPKTRRDLLRATHGQADRWWYLSELAGHMNTTPSSLQRELQSLVSSGILRQRRDGKRIYFRAEEKSLIFAEIRGIVTKTLGIADALESALEEFDDRIICAFVYGSAAGLGEGALGDLDLMVIGSVSLSHMSAPLLVLEKKFNLDFDVTCYSPEEFRERREARTDLIMNILAEEKVFLIGDEEELEKLLKPTMSNQQDGSSTNSERR